MLFRFEGLSLNVQGGVGIGFCMSACEKTSLFPGYLNINLPHKNIAPLDI